MKRAKTSSILGSEIDLFPCKSDIRKRDTEDSSLIATSAMRRRFVLFEMSAKSFFGRLRLILIAFGGKEYFIIIVSLHSSQSEFLLRNHSLFRLAICQNDASFLQI